ncbi:hypothetical protein [Halomonas dongshanensis]|uniref:Uncharacterized protein n=1 Tax=Halomonas dongshanensis TaxID=2890835 RepID=A0ABT2ECI7_9GAMM|nr:hypothetical protein [Halomonas dongshanensis]MCS2609284.1 hypothetical protein [Halomonas dongshanensis]
MEISGSTAAGVIRVGLQVVSSHKKPMLEFYYEVRNRFGPEHEYEMPVGVSGKETKTQKTRFQDIFIQFYVVNIGGNRAENIEFEVSGKLQRNRPRESLGEIMETEIPQMAPGQIVHLFRFDDHDLNIYPGGGGKPLGIKAEELRIVAKYSASPSLLNWIFSIHRKILRKKQYKSVFVFKPQMVCGDLPPAEYA